MNWTIPIIVFVFSNIWGLYCGIPYTTVQPSRSIFDRALGSFQIATTVHAIGETAEYIVHNTTGATAPPTLPPGGDGSIIRVGFNSLPAKWLSAPGNWLDHLVNRWKPIPKGQTGSSHHDAKLPLTVIAGAILVFALVEVNNGQRITQKSLASLAHNQRIDTGEIHAALEDLLSISRQVQYTPSIIQQMAHGEFRLIHRELRRIKELLGVVDQLFRTLREGVHTELARSSGNMEEMMCGCNQIITRLDTIQTELKQVWTKEGMSFQNARTFETADSTENDLHLRETWTEIKDEVQRAAEELKGYMSNMKLDITKLQAIIVAFHEQLSGLPATTTDELARAFNTEMKKHEVEIRTEHARSNGNKRSKSVPPNLSQIDGEWNGGFLCHDTNAAESDSNVLELWDPALREFQLDDTELGKPEPEVPSSTPARSQLEKSATSEELHDNES